MKRRIVIIMLALALAVLTACQVSPLPPQDASVPTEAVTEAPSWEPTREPTEAPTEPPEKVLEMLEVRRQCIVSHPAVGTVYISPEGDMYAIEGENKDGIFNGAECEPYYIEYDMSYGAEFDDYTIFYIKRGSRPARLDRGVEKACMLFWCTAEDKYSGKYAESLIYLKDDGTVWLRGSNPLKLFGDFERAEEPVKLLEGAVNIGSDEYSVAVGMEDGRILAWDLAAQKESGVPMLIAQNADTSLLAGDRMYLTAEGELFADTAVLGERFNYTSFGRDVIRFGRNGGLSFWKLQRDGTLTLYYREYTGPLQETVLEENAVYACSGCHGDGVCCINAAGQLKAYRYGGELQAQMSNAAYGGMENTYCWAVTADNMLFTNNAGGLKRVAEGVAYAVPGVVRGSVLYVTLDGRLFSVNYCTPRELPQDEPYEIVLPETVPNCPD